MTQSQQKRLVSLVNRMLKTFRDLGNDPMARIDARLWAEHYRKRADKITKPTRR